MIKEQATPLAMGLLIMLKMRAEDTSVHTSPRGFVLLSQVFK